ncbi:MAG: glycerol-3-phosphate 1-O-acyltransferase PlsY [Defluviitaleaceae bacterium]|nr:glycerol-3-phosphate 1-O-acyltransferase PlsY [Defluviitaleaceae bacterium]
MFRIACLLIGYAFGCVQTAYFAGLIVKRIDIRKHGSGNAGMTNAFRVLGFKAGAAVFFIDFAKAAAAYLICSALFEGGGAFFGGAAGVIPGVYAGIGAVLGHCFPFYLKFKGGKGFASLLGVLLALDFRTALILYAVTAAIIVFTKYVSLSALAVSFLAPLILWAFGYAAEAFLLMEALTVIVWAMHRENIKRLATGTENKFRLKTGGGGDRKS